MHFVASTSPLLSSLSNSAQSVATSWLTIISSSIVVISSHQLHRCPSSIHQVHGAYRKWLSIMHKLQCISSSYNLQQGLSAITSGGRDSAVHIQFHNYSINFSISNLLGFALPLSLTYASVAYHQSTVCLPGLAIHAQSQVAKSEIDFPQPPNHSLSVFYTISLSKPSALPYRFVSFLASSRDPTFTVRDPPN